MLLPITAIYAALLAVFLVILLFPVIKLRNSLRVGLGDGGKSELQQAMRAHGNAVECIPIFLVLLGIFELNRGPAWALHIFGASFLLARLSHAAGLYATSGASKGRVGGMVGTITVLLLLAIANVVQVFR
jgi:uncharacterized protein